MAPCIRASANGWESGTANSRFPLQKITLPQSTIELWRNGGQPVQTAHAPLWGWNLGSHALLPGESNSSAVKLWSHLT